MNEPFYLAGFERQLTGTPCAGYNCNMAAAAMLADQATLRLVQTTPDRLRALTGTAGTCVDGTIGNEGTTVKQAAAALARVGVHVTAYDPSDGVTWAQLMSWLGQGRFAIVEGDYDRIPLALRGDKDFEGLHSEFWQRVTSTTIRVGDPLNDGRRAGIPKGYVEYPLAIARAYAEKFPGPGIAVAVIDLRRLRKRVAVANIRIGSSRKTAVIGQLTTTATRLAWGGVVHGESIGGDDRWYRVWFPRAARIGYGHASVVTPV